ncbi:MAG: hypothetical protein AB1779_02200 [Candidatus Thermoplasmatota archaeon]
MEEFTYTSELKGDIQTIFDEFLGYYKALGYIPIIIDAPNSILLSRGKKVGFTWKSSITEVSINLSGIEKNINIICKYTKPADTVSFIPSSKLTMDKFYKNEFDGIIKKLKPPEPLFKV